MTTLESALAYAARGWAVFPVHAPALDGKCDCGKSHSDDNNAAKHPRTPHGLKDATTEMTKIREWWTDWPTANIGLLFPGVVLDVDPRHDGLKSLEGKQLPPTVCSTTGGGGFHYFYSYKGTFTVNNAGPGLDLKSAPTGYIIAPGSQHISGKFYEWAHGLSPDEIELAPPPQWLLAILEESKKKAKPIGGGGTTIPEGSRNKTFASFAGIMRRPGMSEESIMAALLVENRRCDPPLPENEVRTIAHSVARYEPTPNSNNSADGGFAQTLACISAANLWDKEYSPPVCLIDELIPEHSCGFVSGPSGARKTWLLLDFAIGIATGKPAFDRFNISGPGAVLFILGEDSLRAMRARVKLVAKGKNLSPADLKNLHFIQATGVLSHGLMRESLIELCNTHQPRLLILDPFVRMHSVDENSSQEIQEILSFLRQLQRDFNISILISHHLKKNRQDDQGSNARKMELMRGSGDLGAWADTVLLVERFGEGADAPSQVTVAKQREMSERAPFMFTLDINGEAARLAYQEGDATDLKIHALMEQILEKLRKTAEGILKNELLHSLKGNTNHRRKALDRLQDAKRLEIKTEKRKAKDGKEREQSVVYLAPSTPAQQSGPGLAGVAPNSTPTLAPPLNGAGVDGLVASYADAFGPELAGVGYPGSSPEE